MPSAKLGTGDEVGLEAARENGECEAAPTALYFVPTASMLAKGFLDERGPGVAKKEKPLELKNLTNKMTTTKRTLKIMSN